MQGSIVDIDVNGHYSFSICGKKVDPKGNIKSNAVFWEATPNCSCIVCTHYNEKPD